jgi:hypothetical protein
MARKIFDVIVIGSGPSGCNSAVTLVENGLDVAMIDGGMQDLGGGDSFRDSFEKIRKERNDQYKLFLGKDFSGLLPRTSHAGSMTSGNKTYISEKTSEFLPIRSNIPIVQSLAKGGLGQAWGGVCDYFDDEELRAVGLPGSEIQEEYIEIISRVGISGTNSLSGMQLPIRLDLHGRILRDRFEHEKQYFDKMGIRGYQPSLALLTEKKGNRQGTTYTGLDFWNNIGGSMYRPKDTIKYLQRKKNFSYKAGHVVMTIGEKNNIVEVMCTELSSSRRVTYYAKRIILAAGAIETVRILLRSKNLYNVPAPFITKSHVLIPGIHLPTLGKKGDDREVSLCQFVLVRGQKHLGMSSAYAQLYSYKSLLLYKLMAYMPLSVPEALSILSVISSSFVLADVRFPTTSSGVKYSMLKKVGPYDRLNVEYKETSQDSAIRKQSTRLMKQALRKLNVFPIKTMHAFTTAHYAGGVPTEQDSKNKFPLHATDSGQVKEFKNVFIADSSTWNALPAKPPTLTLVANANRIGKIVLRTLK